MYKVGVRVKIKGVTRGWGGGRGGGKGGGRGGGVEVRGVRGVWEGGEECLKEMQAINYHIRINLSIHLRKMDFCWSIWN